MPTARYAASACCAASARVPCRRARPGGEHLRLVGSVRATHVSTAISWLSTPGRSCRARSPAQRDRASAAASKSCDNREDAEALAPSRIAALGVPGKTKAPIRDSSSATSAVRLPVPVARLARRVPGTRRRAPKTRRGTPAVVTLRRRPAHPPAPTSASATDLKREPTRALRRSRPRVSPPRRRSRCSSPGRRACARSVWNRPGRSRLPKAPWPKADPAPLERQTFELRVHGGARPHRHARGD
jgi:hypothetical protein